MPTYVYGCDACGHRFEQFQKFSDDPIRICPECRGAVRRILQPAGIVFKGSGWHVTDYKRSGATSESSGEDGGKAAKTEDKKADKPAESKGDAGTGATGDKAKPTATSS